MGQRMKQEGFVDSGFIGSVLKREKLAPTSIGGTIAIPHAFEGHVIKTGVGLMTLRKPIIWGEERVQIVLMLAVDAGCRDMFRDIFDELADIIKNPAVIRQLIEADKFASLRL